MTSSSPLVGPSATPPEKAAWDAATPENRGMASGIASLLNAADKDLQYSLLTIIEGAEADDRKRLEGWLLRLTTHGELMKLSTAVKPANQDIVNMIKKAKGDIEEHFALQTEIISIVLDRLGQESSKETGKNTAAFLDPVQEAAKDARAPYRHPFPTLSTKNRSDTKPIADRVDQVEEWIAGFTAGEGELALRKSSALPDFADIDYAHKTLAEAHAKIDPAASAEDTEATTLRLTRMELSLRAIERADPVGLAKKFMAMNPLEFALSHTSEGTTALLQEGGFVDENGHPRRDVMARNLARYGGSFNVISNIGRLGGIGVVGTLFIMSAIAVTKKYLSGQTLRGHDYLLTLGYGGGALLLAGGIPGKSVSPAEKEAAEEKKWMEEEAVAAIAEKIGMDEALPMIAHAAALGMDEDVEEALNRMGGKKKAGVLIANELHRRLEKYPEKIKLLREFIASRMVVTPHVLRDVFGNNNPAYSAMMRKDATPDDRRMILMRLMDNHIEKNENLLAVVAALEYHA